jgi:hypothetical protein
MFRTDSIAPLQRIRQKLRIKIFTLLLIFMLILTIERVTEGDGMAEKEKFDYSNLHALFINCTLKKSPEKSNTQGLVEISRNIMEKHGVYVV